MVNIRVKCPDKVKSLNFFQVGYQDMKIHFLPEVVQQTLLGWSGTTERNRVRGRFGVEKNIIIGLGLR